MGKRHLNSENYVVAVYDEPQLFDVEDVNQLEFKRGNLVKIGYNFLVTAINILTIADKKGRRLFLITPHYSGYPSFTKRLNEAFRFKSLNQANLAGKRIGAPYEVLTTAYLNAEQENASLQAGDESL